MKDNKYNHLLDEVINYFINNTPAQLIKIDIYTESLELRQSKDNSQCQRVQELYMEFKEAEPELTLIKNKFINK